MEKKFSKYFELITKQKNKSIENIENNANEIIKSIINEYANQESNSNNNKNSEELFGLEKYLMFKVEEEKSLELFD